MKRVMCIVTDGFEELEAIGTIALLRRAGMIVDVYAIDKQNATGRFDISVDQLLDLRTADVKSYDMLFLPGGPHHAVLAKNTDVLTILHTFYNEDKWISAICAAPIILGKQGMLKNKQYTCFTSMNEDFGGTYIDQYAVCDGKIITGRSAAAVIDFAFLIIEKLLGTVKKEEVQASIYYESSTAQ